MSRQDISAVCQLVLLTSLLAVLLAGPAVRAELPVTLPEAWPGLDSDTQDLVNASRFLRISEDGPALLEKNGELARGDLDNPWVAYSLARNARVALGRRAALQAIAARDLAALTGGSITDARITDDQWLLMQGVLDWLGQRYASAEKVIDDLAARYPDWRPVLEYMRWYCLEARLAPLSEYQECADTMAGDGVALNELLLNLVSRHNEDADDLAVLTAFLERGPDHPQVNLFGEAVALQRSWLEGAPGLRDLEDQWRDLLDRYGDLAYLISDDFSFAIAVRYPAERSEPVLGRLGRSRLGLEFALRQVEELWLSQQDLRAQQMLGRMGNVSHLGQVLQLKIADRLSHADSLRAVLARTREERIVTGNTVEVKSMYVALGQEDTWGEVWQELTRENPVQTIEHRLDQLTQDRVPEFQALRDSLQALGIYTRTFKRSFEYLDAAASTEVDLAALVAEEDPYRRGRLFSLANVTARALGGRALRDTLARLEIATTNNPSLVRERALPAVFNADLDLVRTAVHRLDELGEDLPSGLEFRLYAQRALEGEEAARATLQGMNINMINSVTTLGQVVGFCQILDLPDLLSQVRGRLQVLAPESYTTKMVAVADEKMRGDHDAAAAILRGLAVEFPGSQIVQKRMMEVADSVVPLKELQQDMFDRANLFVPFGDDLDDLTTVTGRRVDRTDSLASDMVILLERRSVVFTGMDSAYERRRIIAQVLTRAGAEQWRTYTFGYNPDEGVPQVRAARVFTPDGKVLDTDPGNIQVRAPEGQDADVTDAREVVIPFSSVTPGSIVDLVYDSQKASDLNDQWSMMEFFIGDALVKEYVLEMQAPPDLPIRAVVHGNITEEPVETTGVRRWVVHDLPLAREEEFRPALNKVVPWVGLTTTPSWEEAGAGYGRLFWQTAKVSPRVQALADSLTAGADGKREKAEALYRHVVQEITPLLVELGLGRMLPSTSEEVLDRGWGDCKDVSHLLITLLEAADIEAHPVLVSTLGHLDPRDDLPSLMFFDHMIVRITDLKGDPYCDPLNGTDCLDYLPTMNAGRRCLLVRRDGKAELATVTEPRAEDSVSDLTVDIEPVGEQALRYRIASRFTGEIAGYMRRLTAFGDTSLTRTLLDRSVGYGVPEGVPIMSWSVSEGDCGALEIAMTYVDSTWAAEGASSALLHHANEGSVWWELPQAKDRLYDVIFPAPYTSRLVLRLHGSDIWTPDRRVVPFSIENDFAEGKISGDDDKVDGRRVVTVEHDFVLKSRDVPRDSYKAFRQDALAFAMFSAQRFDYRKVLDKDLVKEMEQYAKQNPQDEGFRLNAAVNLLGSDLGGMGEEGDERREAAMELMKPLVEKETPHKLGAILVARIHMKESRYVQAAEVVEAALPGAPDDPYLLMTMATACMELERWETASGHLATLANTLGDAGLIKQYVTALLMLEDEDGARQQFDRLRLMGKPVSEQEEAFIRMAVAEKKDDLAGLKEYLEVLEADPESEQLGRLVRCNINELEGNVAASIPIYESMIAENPSNSLLCNNLAWTYALSGQNLERALMLARVATLLSDDPASSRNTYATVLARMGKWKEAREIFRDMYENDDRPTERKVNGYFLGLAEASLGNEDKAREIWSTVKDLPAETRWTGFIEQSQRALDEGGDITEPVFGG